MPDINLLRWHPPANRVTQTRWKFILILFATTMLGVFFILDLHLRHENLTLTLTLNQAMLEVKNNKPHDISAPEIVSEDILNHCQLSQKALWQGLTFYDCLRKSRLRISRINLAEKQFHITGFVESPLILTSAIEFCLLEKNKSSQSVKYLVFNHLKNTSLLKFSINLI